MPGDDEQIADPPDLAHDLVRNRSGRVIHRTTCPQADQAAGAIVPWAWAEGRELKEVRLAAAMVGSVPCARCHPFGPAPTPF